MLRNLLLIASLLLLCRCGPTGYQAVVVTLDSTAVATVPIRSYLMRNSLDGKPSTTGPQDVALNQVPFTVLVPRGKSGALLIKVEGLNAFGAVLAQGEATVTLDGDKDQTLRVRLSAVAPDPARLAFAAPAFVGSALFGPLAGVDLTGDFKPDLLALDPMGVLLQTLRNQGAGVFGGTAKPASAGQLVQSLALGDVNGDGKLDALVAELEAGAAAVLLGSGDGAFQAPRALPALGASARAIAIADLDGDGAKDLLLAYRTGVTVLKGKGDGTFAARADVELGLSVRAAALRDLSDDGVDDVVVVHEAGARVLIGAGDGTFKNGKDGKDLAGVSAGFDSVVIAGWDLVLGGAPGVVVVPGKGDGTFRAAQPLAASARPTALLGADVNDDDKEDVVVVSSADDNVTVFLGNGDGSYQGGQGGQAGQGGRSFPAGHQPNAVTVLDANGDGLLDLALIAREGEGTESRISLLLNTTK